MHKNTRDPKVLEVAKYARDSYIHSCEQETKESLKKARDLIKNK